jgi:hypothetical protein
MKRILPGLRDLRATMAGAALLVFIVIWCVVADVITVPAQFAVPAK